MTANRYFTFEIIVKSRMEGTQQFCYRIKKLKNLL